MAVADRDNLDEIEKRLLSLGLHEEGESGRKHGDDIDC